MTLNITTTKFRTFILMAFIFLFAIFGTLVIYRLVSGRSLGIRSFAENQLSSAKSRVLATSNRSTVTSSNKGDYTNVIFLHHSTGRNLIEQGHIRETLTKSGIQFWDHDYNYIGLKDPSGKLTGYSYFIPKDKTDPDGLAEIFGQTAYGQPVNAFSALLQHEVIAFKSCYPASDIADENQLEQYKSWYLDIRDAMDQHPDKIFIVFTPPPLNPASTRPEIAANARAFSNWMTSEEYSEDHPNVYVFDFFNLLAEDDPQAPDFNMLREEFRDGTIPTLINMQTKRSDPFLLNI